MIWKYDPWMYGEDKPLNKEFPLDEIIKKNQGVMIYKCMYIVFRPNKKICVFTVT